MRSGWRTWLRRGAVGLLGVLLLGGLALQIPMVAGWALNAVLGAAARSAGASLTLDAARPEGWSAITLLGVRFRARKGVSVRVGAARIRWHPASIVAGTVAVDTLLARDVAVTIPAKPSGQGPPVPGSGPGALVDKVFAVLRGDRWTGKTIALRHVTIQAASIVREPRLRVDSIALVAQDARLGREPAGALRELQARIRVGDSSARWVRVTGAGRLAARRVDLDVVAARGPADTGVAHVMLVVPDSGRVPLTAALTARGIGPTVRGIPLRTQLAAALERGRATLTASAASGVLTVNARGWARSLDAPVSYDLQVDARQLTAGLHRFELHLAPDTGGAATANVRASTAAGPWSFQGRVWRRADTLAAAGRARSRVADLSVRELAATVRPRLTAQVRLGSMLVVGRRLRGADLTASWSRGQLSVRGGVVGPGRLQLTGTVGPLNSKARFEISHLAFADLDLSRLIPRAPPTSLSGELVARGQVGNLRKAVVIGQVSLSRSQIDRFTLAGVAGHLQLAAGEVQTDMEVRTDAVRARAQVAADIGAIARHWRIAGVVDGERLAGTGAGSAAPPVRLVVRLHADGAGINPRTAHASADVTGTARLDSFQVDSLAARVRLRNGALRVDTVLARASVGELGGSGTLAVGRNAGHFDLRVRATAALQPTSPVLPGLADTRLERGILDVHATGPPDAIHLDVRGSAIALHRQSTSADSLSFHGAAEIAGRRAIQHADATVEVAGLRAGAFTAPRARVQAGWNGRSAAIAVQTGLGPHGELAGAADVVPSAESLLVNVRDLAVRVGRDRWTLTRKPIVVLAKQRVSIDGLEARSGEHSVALEGSLDRSGPVRLRLTARQLPIGLALGRQSRDAFDGRLDAGVEVSGDAASPVVVARADASVARADSARGKPDSTAGPVRLRGDIRWAGDSLALKADLLTRSDSALAVIRGTLPLALSLAANPPGGRVVRETQRDIALSLQADRIDLAVVPRLVNSRTLAGLSGIAMVHARVEGPPDRPNATGEVAVRDAALKLPSLGVVYEQIGLRARLASGGRVEVDSGRIVSSNGELTAKGTVELRRSHLGELDLGVALRDFRVIATDQHRVTASGDLRIRGTPLAPVLHGQLEVSNSSVTLGRGGTSNARPVDLGPADLQMLREYFGDAVLEQPRTVPAELYRASALDVDVTVGRGTWVRHLPPPRFQLELTGRVRARKAPKGELSLQGSIEPVAGGKSEIEQYGRRFELTGGKATFDGPLSAARFDLGARYRTTTSVSVVENRKDVTVRARVQGRMDSLNVALTSEPPMAQSDIVSYLVTGVAETQTFSAQEAQQATAAAATNVATAAAASSLAEAGRKASGLDVVRIQQDGRHGTTLVAGQYVAPRVYVGFRQPMVYKDDPDQTSGTGARTTFEAEYAAFEWLVTNAQGASDRLRLVLRARHEY